MKLAKGKSRRLKIRTDLYYKKNIKIVYIKNTNEMAEIWLSEALWKEAEETPGLEFIKEDPFVFDANDNLI